MNPTNDGWIPFCLFVVLWYCALLSFCHSFLGYLNRLEPSLMPLVTLVLFLLWQNVFSIWASQSFCNKNMFIWIYSLYFFLAVFLVFLILHIPKHIPNIHHTVIIIYLWISVINPLTYMLFPKHNLHVYCEQWPITALSWFRGFAKYLLILHMERMQHLAMNH